MYRVILQNFKITLIISYAEFTYFISMSFISFKNFLKFIFMCEKWVFKWPNYHIRAAIKSCFQKYNRLKLYLVYPWISFIQSRNSYLNY